jgi:hypothetical protein
MVNNYTDINKVNNPLWPQIIEHKKKYHEVGNPGLGQANKCGGVKPDNGIPFPLPSW